MEVFRSPQHVGLRLKLGESAEGVREYSDVQGKGC